MKLNIRFSQWHLFLGVAFISFIILSNCEDKPLEAGLDILPEGDLLEVIVDTLPVELYTVSNEALVTKSIGYSPLGSVNDPEIGIVETNFITDFIYDDEVSYIDGTLDDSLFIVDLSMELHYVQIYGDSSQVDFNIYELTEPLPDYNKSDYQIYSHMFDPEPLNIGTPEYIADSTSVFLKVELSSDFARRLITATEEDSSIYLEENQRQFKDEFKGFYFAATPRESVGGGILIVSHYDSKMYLRTRQFNYDSTRWDTITDVFTLGNPESTIDTGGVHLNLYRGTFSDQINTLLNNTDTLNSRVYIQSLTGPRVLARIPALDEIRDEHLGEVSVNFAHLYLPYDEEIYLRDSAFYNPVDQIGVYDSESNDIIIDNISSINHLGGLLNWEEGYYKLNIGNHVHDYLREEDSGLSNALYLFAAAGSPASPLTYIPERIVLYGTHAENAEKQPYLRIVYSIIPK